VASVRQAARDAEADRRRAEKRPALANITNLNAALGNLNLPMSAPLHPSSSSSWDSSASSLSSSRYAVRADPGAYAVRADHSPAASFSCATAAPAACRFPQLMD
jgi:hypothetical protein